jgi:predicted permease
MDLDRGERAERIQGSAVSGNYFSLLGVRPAVGRFFRAEEDRAVGTHPVAVISEGFWRRHFGADRSALGKPLLLNGQGVTIIGVAERSFTGTEPTPVDVWVPAAMAGPLGLMAGGAEDWRNNAWMVAVGVLGRLAPGADPARVQADAAATLRREAAATPSLDQTPGVVLGSLIPARGPHRSPAASLSLWLLAMAAIVLVIASANVANLLLARAATRRREIAVRVSLGAGRARVVRHHLLESLLLALGGGAAGLLLAFLGSALIRRFPLPATAGETNLRVVAFTFAVAALSGTLFGLVPAIRSLRASPADELRDRQAGGCPERGRMRRTLVTIQVALSLVLLVGAGLFIRSVGTVSRIDPGVAYDRLLVVSADFQRTGRPAGEQAAFYEGAMERVRKLPGVRGAAMTHFSPFSGVAYGTGLKIPGRVLPKESTAMLNYVGSGYFAVAGTPILRGRAITDEDRKGSAPVAVVNESMAKVMELAGSRVVGECVVLDSREAPDRCTRVVGVAMNQRARFLSGDVQPTVILAQAQTPEPLSWGGPALLVRTNGEPGKWTASIRSALQGLSPDLPYVAVQPVAERIRSELLPFQLGATLFSLFGVLALLLAAIGLAGVLSYYVGERTGELGIRRALGALDRDITRMVVRQGLVPVGAGLLLGVAAAWAGARLLEAHLYRVSAREPAVFGAAVFFLLAAAVAASYLPARRATSVDPAAALRSD